MKSSIVITHNPADFMFSAGIRSYTTMTFLPKVLSPEVKNNSIKNQKQ